MARRRRINAPSQADLQALEEGFARETDPRSGLPPIAQVAGEAARLSDPVPAEEQLARARDAKDAEDYRAARDRGLVVMELPITAIHADELSRDRMGLDDAEMDELTASIDAHGLRLPIEVFALPEPRDNLRFGLISGYRRLMAVWRLADRAGDHDDRTIKALVRAPETLPEAFVAMVEENEIRADLSQYERGRIAVLAAEQGVYGSVEEAVDALFQAGSKAKRSKIRSFALLHESLGDLLRFPTALSERAGLKVAKAIKEGRKGVLRRGLMAETPQSAEEEWAVLSPLVQAKPPAPSGVHPDDPPPPRPQLEERDLGNGVVITGRPRKGAYVIEISGGGLGDEDWRRALKAVVLELE